jgi:hypothetical protein
MKIVDFPSPEDVLTRIPSPNWQYYLDEKIASVIGPVIEAYKQYTRQPKECLKLIAVFKLYLSGKSITQIVTLVNRDQYCVTNCLVFLLTFMDEEVVWLKHEYIAQYASFERDIKEGCKKAKVDIEKVREGLKKLIRRKINRKEAVKMKKYKPVIGGRLYDLFTGIHDHLGRISVSPRVKEFGVKGFKNPQPFIYVGKMGAVKGHLPMRLSVLSTSLISATLVFLEAKDLVHKIGKRGSYEYWIRDIEVKKGSARKKSSKMKTETLADVKKPLEKELPKEGVISLRDIQETIAALEAGASGAGD